MTDRTRTASSVGTEAEGRSAQNPVDRQVGEARERIARIIDPHAFGLPVAGRGPLPGFVSNKMARDYNRQGAFAKADAILAASDLEQVTRERNEAVAALEKIANPPYGLGFNRLRGLARQVLASLRSMEKAGG